MQPNCYFVHLQNLLLALLGYENKTVRAKAVDIIQKIRYAKERNQEGEQDPVREFHLPRCNFATTSYIDQITLKDNGRGNGVTYLTHKKGYLVLHEPPLFKSYTDIKQFVKQPLHLNYPNHTRSVECAVKLTTTASGRIAGAKRQIGEALCLIAGRKKQWIGKKYYVTRKAAHASQ